MQDSHLAEVDRTLLLIAEARERAERAARAMRREEAEPRLVEALQEADKSLLKVHGELMRSTYFESSAKQLKLSA